jgi:heterodisulfide reductase subunit A-like polyferredoxin
MGIEVNKWGTLIINPKTLETNREGVFAGGDVVTGPNTVVDAIAAGKKVAIMIDRYLNGEKLDQPLDRRVPSEYVPPYETGESDEELHRIKLPTISAEQRIKSTEEVELVLDEASAKYEAGRCMRCDIDFTYSRLKQLELEDAKNEITEKGEVLV